MSLNNLPSHWTHRPDHFFRPDTFYMITGTTLHRERFFYGRKKLRMLHNLLLEVFCEYGWELQAWAVFYNHYHLIAKSPPTECKLRSMIQRIHSQSAREVNQMDGTGGRQVWFQYHDSCLTFEKSYLARLKYVHFNAVKHRLVERPEEYPWCSAAWFADQAERGFREKVLSFKIDKLNVEDIDP